MITYPLFQILSDLVVELKPLLDLFKLLIRRFAVNRDDGEVTKRGIAGEGWDGSRQCKDTQDEEDSQWCPTSNASSGAHLVIILIIVLVLIRRGWRRGEVEEGFRGMRLANEAGAVCV